MVSLVSIKSIQVGLSDLKQVGFLTTFSKFQLFMKSLKIEFSSPRLKSGSAEGLRRSLVKIPYDEKIFIVGEIMLHVFADFFKEKFL